MLLTGVCQDGQRSTSVCSFQTVLSGAWITVSVLAWTRALGSTPSPRQVRGLSRRGVAPVGTAAMPRTPATASGTVNRAARLLVLRIRGMAFSLSV